MYNFLQNKKYVFAVLVLFVAAGCSDKAATLLEQAPAHAESTAQESVGGIPKAVFPEMTHDFTSVMEGEDIKHDFVIENHGDAPLIIEKVKPG